MVIALASFSIAQIWFVVGDRYGPALINHRPAWQQRLGRVDNLLQRYGNGLVLGFRALFGLRTIIPIAVGTTEYLPRRFILLNGLGALIWAVVVTLAGNSIAQLLEVLVADLRQYELGVALVVAMGGLVWGFVHLYRQPKVPR